MNAPAPKIIRDLREALSGLSRQELELRVQPGLGLDASAVLLWEVNVQRQIQLAGEIGMNKIGGKEVVFVPSRLKSLGDIIETKRSSFFRQEQLPDILTCYQAILRIDDEVLGVVELVWHGEPTDFGSLAIAAEKFVNDLANSLFQTTRSSSRLHDLAEWSLELDNFLLDLYQAHSTQEAAMIAVNDGRLLLGVDRLMLAVRKGSRSKMIAVTGQSVVQYQAPAMIAIQKLTQLVLDSGDETLYDGAIVGLPVQTAELLSNYLNENRSRMLWILPLTSWKEVPSRDPMEVRAERVSQVVGCLVLESFRESRVGDETRERTDILAEHIALAIRNSQRHEAVFLLPVLDSIGRLVETLNNRSRNWIVASIAIAFGLMALLIYLPWEYKVTSNGILMPIERADLFAPWDAEVVEVFVEDGQTVKTEQPLLRLRSDELNIESVTLAAMVAEKRKKLLSSLQSQMDRMEQSGEMKESLRLQGESKRTEIEIQGTEEKLELIQKRLESLVIRSPVDGTIATFQLEQLLLHRPVK